jgi:hypothetical protein
MQISLLYPLQQNFLNSLWDTRKSPFTAICKLGFIMAQYGYNYGYARLLVKIFHNKV